MHPSRTHSPMPGRRLRHLFLPLVAGLSLLLAGAAQAATQTTESTSTSGSSTVQDATSARTGDTAVGRKTRKRTWPPTPNNVGIPARAELSTYRGPCTIRKRGKVLKKKVINCSPLRIETRGVVIKKSLVNGSVHVGQQDDYNPTTVSDPEGDGPIRVKVVDSEIDTSAGTDRNFRPISSSHYVVKRSYLHGGESGAECHNACTIKWSYVHGFGEHASGLRILRNGTLKNNTIWCEPNPSSDEDGNGVPDPDGGCSGNLVMYEEFGTPHHNLVKHNYFPAGKFYYAAKFNGEDHGHIRFVNNRFGRPRDGGRRVADDWENKRSNVWKGNTLTNGRTARP